jgi:glycosyltransferase involved in cell wall biosynthesis
MYLLGFLTLFPLFPALLLWVVMSLIMKFLLKISLSKKDNVIIFLTIFLIINIYQLNYTFGEITFISSILNYIFILLDLIFLIPLFAFRVASVINRYYHSSPTKSQ